MYKQVHRHCERRLYRMAQKVSRYQVVIKSY